MRIRTVVAALTAVIAPVVLSAQAAPDTLDLTGRNLISLGIGLTGVRNEIATTGSTYTHANGEVSTLGFRHWVRPSTSVDITMAVLSAEARTSGASTHTNAIIPMLVGLSYAPPALALSRSIRPYVAGAVGPYLHVVSDVSAGSVSNTSETAAGARGAVGVHWFVARHFAIGAEGEYHAVGSFEHKDALTHEPSGFGAQFVIGIPWGGR